MIKNINNQKGGPGAGAGAARGEPARFRELMPTVTTNIRVSIRVSDRVGGTPTRAGHRPRVGIPTRGTTVAARAQ